MCGIVGYIGTKRNATPVLLDGLRRLEYRGYDSAGLAILDDSGTLHVYKQKGPVNELSSSVPQDLAEAHLGIAHTRWATHGEPTRENAHPHADNRGDIFIVHNGVIENYAELKDRFLKEGHVFHSETDTEVLAHLIGEHAKVTDSLKDAVISALKEVRGTYGIAVMRKHAPSELVVARMGSPLLIGIGNGEYFVASDASAIIPYTKHVIYLEDGEIAHLTKDTHEICTTRHKKVEKSVEEVTWSMESAEKSGYDHFMLKEIMEQPQTVRDSIRGRLHVSAGKAVLGGLKDVQEELKDIDRIIIVACGSAYLAGLVGEYMIEEYAGIPVEVEYASEFRYRKPLIGEKTAVIAITQSGETADTLAAIREAKTKGALTLGIVNTVGSTIARETDAGVYNHAGPEIGVASTKAFISQVTVLALYAMTLGRTRDMSVVTGKRIAEELQRLPEKIESILAQSEQIREITKAYANARDYYFLGRKYNAPIGYEGALKLKETSYVHAEGYPAGEMKHGPIALIDPDFVSIFLAPVDSVYEKTKSNIEETKARGGKIICITTEGNSELEALADHVIYIPKTLEMLMPILTVIPLQLFAYHMSVSRGYNPDRPRNLAKSVTVE